MTYSMTGYARCEHNADFGSLTWELKSVNHRFLEISLRLPEGLKTLEAPSRTHIQKQLSRGKIDANLRFRPQAAKEIKLEINQPLTRGLLNACREIEGMIMNSARITPIEILAWPGIVVHTEELSETVTEAALTLLEQTLKDLQDSRKQEGMRLAEGIESRCRALQDWVAKVRTRRPEVVQALRARLLQRIADLDVELDPTRLEQELALQAQRLDVAEELDRLDGHVEEIQSVLQRTESVGRRLDFLLQELHREANTLSSKSNDMETTRASVEIKVVIEQMREQVQNIE